MGRKNAPKLSGRSENPSKLFKLRFHFTRFSGPVFFANNGAVYANTDEHMQHMTLFRTKMTMHLHSSREAVQNKAKNVAEWFCKDGSGSRLWTNTIFIKQGFKIISYDLMFLARLMLLTDLKAVRRTKGCRLLKICLWFLYPNKTGFYCSSEKCSVWTRLVFVMHKHCTVYLVGF